MSMCEGLETSRFRNFCHFFRVVVSVSENSVSKKVSVSENLLSEKISVLVSENLVSEKVSVSENLVSEKKKSKYYTK